jgi:hypothetical protein
MCVHERPRLLSDSDRRACRLDAEGPRWLHNSEHLCHAPEFIAFCVRTRTTGRAYRVLVLVEAGPATISAAERRKLDDR